MTMMSRKISHDELAQTLPLLAVTQIRNDVLEACCEVAEDPQAPDAALPVGIEFWYADGILEALSQADVIEAGFDHSASGHVLAEFEVGPAFHRCIVCGEPNRKPSSWCGRRCRTLLRDHVSHDLGAAEEWAVTRRNAAVGWLLPLTREIAEALYWRG